MAKKRIEQQVRVHSSPYGWRSVLDLDHIHFIVVNCQDAALLAIRREGGIVWVMYTEPETGAKREQFYNTQDSVYVRLSDEDSGKQQDTALLHGTREKGRKNGQHA